MIPSPHRNKRPNNLKLSGLGRIISRLKVSVLPDFFLDRIISVPSLNKLFKEAKAKAAAGGGNLRGYLQTEIRGGNATNLAYGLASLSVRTSLFCIGDAFADVATVNAPANCQVRVIPGRTGLTVALEFPFKARIVNVMISDVGGAAHFDGRKFNPNDISALKESDCIALVNWSANKSGNALARKVFAINGCKARLCFLDPADLSGAENRIKPLRKIIDEGLINVISLNENEARILTKVLKVGRLPQRYNPHDVLRVSAGLHDALHATVDIHTPIGSVSANNEQQAWAPVRKFVRGFVTGAGDVWDAGDIIGHLIPLNADDRLRFANACAYLYLSSGRIRPPNLREVECFLLRDPESRELDLELGPR